MNTRRSYGIDLRPGSRRWGALCLLVWIVVAVWVLRVHGAAVVVPVKDISGGSPAGRAVTFTLTKSQGSVMAGPWAVAGDSVVQLTDATGATTFSNMWLIGQYRCDISGNPSRSFPFSLSATNGYYNIGQLLGTNVFPEQFYDVPQVDALIRAAGTTNGQTVSAAGPGIAVATNGNVFTISTYAGPSITSLTNSVGSVVENGTVVNSTTLGWSITAGSYPVASESLNQGIGALSPATLRAYTNVATYTTSRTYTLTVSDGYTSPTASTTVSFQNKFYWGAQADAAITDPEILGLSSMFATSKAQSFTSVSATAQYLYFCYPASFGTATFTVNGLPNTDWTLTTRSFVNSQSLAVSYNIYRSNNLLTGSYNVVVQ